MRFKTVCLVLLACTPLCPQVSQGNLAGTVRDQTGAAVPAAAVRMTNLGTGATRLENTDTSGLYRFNLIDSGNYRVEIQGSGFKRFVVDNVEVRSGQTVAADAMLELGQLTESVNVSGEAILLRTESGSLGSSVSGAAVNELPIANRTALNFLQLAPGVQYASGTPLNAWDNDGPSRFAVNGSLARSEILMDGVPSMRPSAAGQLGGAAGFSPSSEAVQEIRVQNNAYDAEYGHSGGAFINISTKSGTNQLHGDTYWYHLNDNLNANTYFNNLNGRPKAETKTNIYGISVGGPVMIPKLYNGRDRTHFYVGYEGTQRRNFAVARAIVPTELERRGDFSQTRDRLGNPFTIYDPSTTRQSGTGYVRTPYPGNIIPPSQHDPVALNLMKFYPLPNTPTSTDNLQNFENARPTALKWNSIITRIDHQLNSKHHLFFRLGWNHRIDENEPFWGECCRAAGNPGSDIFHRYNKILAVSDTWIMNTRTVVDFRFGVYRYYDTDLVFGDGFDLTSVGFPTSFSNSSVYAVFPQIVMADVGVLGTNEAPNEDGTTSIDPVVNFSTNAGRHMIKYGFRGRGSQVNSFTAGRSSGEFRFDRTFTRGPDPTRNTANSGHDFASFLIGAPYQGFADIIGSKTVINTYYGFYIQDDWKITNRLTLNLGMRFEHEDGVTERYDRGNGGFDFGATSPLEAAVKANYAQNPIPELAALNIKGGLRFLNVGGVPRENLNMPALLYSPRFAFAYRLTDWMAWRGGWGVFLAPNQVDNFTQDGFSLSTQMVTSLDGNLTPFRRLADPFPDGLSRPPGSAAGLLTGLGQSLIAGAAEDNGVPRYRHGLSQHFSMGFQFVLPAQFSLETSYVGNVSQRLMAAKYDQGSISIRGRQVNDIPNQYLALKTRLNARVPNPFFGVITDPTSLLSQPTVTVGQLLKPYPHLLSLIQSTLPLGRSHYDSLQVNLARRFTGGLYLAAGYTFSKFMDASGYLNPNDAKPERVISDLDRPHRLVFSGLFDIPVGKGKRFLNSAHPLVRQSLGGWQINWIGTFQSGPALAFTGAERVAKSDENPHTMVRWFDPNQFVVQEPFTLRQLSTRLPDLRGPGINKWDLSLVRNFPITERLRVNFRVQAFNAFNRTHFGNPNTSFTNTSFARITTASLSREIQLAMRVTF